MDGFVGFKYQCEGQLAASFDVEITAAGVPDESFGAFFDFGDGSAGDSYEKPFVMACCPDYEAAPNASLNCAKPHNQACVVDMVQQGCGSLVARMNEWAEQQGAVASNAGFALANWVADNQQACFDTFIVDTNILNTPPSCDGSNNENFNYDSELSGTSWTFNPGVTGVGDVTITIDTAQIVDFYPLPADSEPTPVQCESAEENDGVSFLEHDPDPSFTYELASGDATVSGMYSGSYVEASADFAGTSNSCTLCSYVSHQAASGTLDALVLDSEDPATVTWSTSQLLTPDRFRLALYSPVAVSSVGWEHYRAAAGSAMFVVSMEEAGVSTMLFGTNDNAIDLKRAGLSQPWKIKPFTLKYTDSQDELWAIYVKELTFEL
jgi:hypothetical protein